ncbi:outer membrane usher protein [Raoultella sp. BIGb0399]|uniref:Fimbria/pilus outer membrane usher protein n=1 Tax=Raoultella lignicola TaxID=3040939 RepID=A0ABU9FE79_9ENTR|nr:fimbria/pilus outer membrane usher protein [Raoultella sp. BIGb0399]ROS13387.1 outer membrane usher protein [Raoultella sp. BIGb0399]
MRKLLSAGQLTALTAAIFCVLYGSRSVRAELYFNVNSLNLTDEQRQQIDLDLLSRTDIQMPGEYDVNVRVNRSDAGRYRMNFVACDNRLCPELTPELLGTLGVKTQVIPGIKNLAPDAIITHLEALLPGAETPFDFGRGILDISIPQAAMDNRARGYIPPEQWDDGLPFLFTSYSASGSENHNRNLGQNTSTQYVNFRSGANFGAWRLRNTGYYQANAARGQWQNLETRLERDIRSLRSRLVMGDTSSPGIIFDSFSFRGVSLSTQDSMLPDSQQGYAPQITGVAVTNATVEIRQNGNLLYQTFVSPGAFIIDDLYATSTSGDLQITVREEDGSVRSWTQSFASPPISIRQGALKYSATAGKFGAHYYHSRDTQAQRFIQAEFLYGVLNSTSLYAGLIAAEHYRSGMLGVGQALGILGALSLDVTHAQTHFSSGEKQTGQSWRARYSKRFEVTGTSMTLAGYRYATDGYYDFDEASNSYHTAERVNRTILKSRAQLSLSQDLGPLGSLALSANQQEYWNGYSRSRSLTGGWSKTFNGVTVNLSQTQSKSWRSGKTDNVTSFSISLPIGQWLSGHGSSIRMNTSYTRSDSGSATLNSTLSGTALAGRNLSWAASQGYRQEGSQERNSTALSGTYRGGLGSLSVGYSNYYGESRQFNWGAQGAVVVHPHGVTLSPPLYEGSAYALVRSPGADGVRVKNQIGLTTDWRGYAVVPSMMAYRENRVGLDTATLGENVDLKQAEVKVVPTREALVLADFNTSKGYRSLLTLKHAGQAVPFGAMVSAGDSQGIVGDGGQVYLSGMADGTALTVVLSADRSCSGIFEEKKAMKVNGLMMAETECL